MIKQIALWSCLFAALPLPGLSIIGYLPWMLEYLTILAASLALGTFAALLSRWRIPAFLLLITLTLSWIFFYFEHSLSKPLLPLILSSLAASGFIIFAWYHQKKALLLAACAAASHIISAAVLSPLSTTELHEKTVARSDAPSIIHLILDEHAGLASFPEGSVPESDLRTFAKDYTDHGFLVFTHAYTIDNSTESSLGHLFNSMTAPIDSISHRIPDGIWDRTAFDKTTALDNISKTRALDITQTKYIDFRPAELNNPNLARLDMYDMRNKIAMVPDMDYRTRMQLATRLELAWAKYSLQSPAADFLDRTFSPTSYATPNAFGSRAALESLTERLSTTGQRDTYYLAHLLLPHYPFVLDADCHSLPLNLWQTHFRSNSPLSHNDMWRAHFEQARCSKKLVLALADAATANPQLSNAVIFVHSDHGARLISRNCKHCNGDDYFGNLTSVQAFGSFIAIRIPGMKGRVIDAPVRLDLLYLDLQAHNFRSLDIKAISANKGVVYPND